MRTMNRRRSVSFALIALLAAFTTVCGSAEPQALISGEVVETFCWAKLGVGGEAHASCGIECAKRGIPVGIYDAQTRSLFILLPARDKSALPPDLVAAMGKRVNARGEIVKRAGTSFFSVQSWSEAER